MKVLVAYAGKSGTTRKCVDHIKNLSTEDVTLYDTKAGGALDINEYDVVIMGGSIRIGVMDNSIRKFAKEHDLSGKIVGLFVVCGTPENSRKYLRTNFPTVLSPHSEACFGGELPITRVKGLEKFIIKRAIKDCKKKNKQLPSVDYDKIKQFLEDVYEFHYKPDKPKPDPKDLLDLSEDKTIMPEPKKTKVEPKAKATPKTEAKVEDVKDDIQDDTKAKEDVKDDNIDMPDLDEFADMD